MVFVRFLPGRVENASLGSTTPTGREIAKIKDRVSPRSNVPIFRSVAKRLPSLFQTNKRVSFNFLLSAVDRPFKVLRNGSSLSFRGNRDLHRLGENRVNMVRPCEVPNSLILFLARQFSLFRERKIRPFGIRILATTS